MLSFAFGIIHHFVYRLLLFGLWIYTVFTCIASTRPLFVFFSYLLSYLVCWILSLLHLIGKAVHIFSWFVDYSWAREYMKEFSGEEKLHIMASKSEWFDELAENFSFYFLILLFFDLGCARERRIIGRGTVSLWLLLCYSLFLFSLYGVDKRDESHESHLAFTSTFMIEYFLGITMH